MFGLLIKHEWKQTWRALALIVLAAGAIAVVGLVPSWLGLSLLAPFGRGVSLITFIVLPALVLVYLAMRYYQSMYGRQGYLTMTLPVRGRVVYAAKLLHAIVVAALMMLVSVLGIAVIFRFDPSVPSIDQLLASADWTLVASVALLVTIQTILTIALGAFALSYGSEGRFGSGFTGVVIVGVVSYVVTQLLMIISLLFVPLGLRIVPGEQSLVVLEGMLPALLSEAPTAPVMGLGPVFVMVVLTVVSVWWTIHSIENHTSLR